MKDRQQYIQNEVHDNEKKGAKVYEIPVETRLKLAQERFKSLKAALFTISNDIRKKL